MGASAEGRQDLEMRLRRAMLLLDSVSVALRNEMMWYSGALLSLWIMYENSRPCSFENEGGVFWAEVSAVCWSS